MAASIPSPVIKVDSTIILELIDDVHTHSLFELIDNNRAYLGKWLPWVSHMQTPQNLQAYIERCKRQHASGTDYGYVIMVSGQPAGRIGIHYIDQQNQLGSIGYWLGEKFAGRGIITKACIALTNYCFQTIGLNRIEIKCATGNYKSAAVAERLQFTREGILRQAEWVNNQFLDLYLYAKLRSEWNMEPYIDKNS